MVVTKRHTIVGLGTTTRNTHIVLLLQTQLSDSVTPVSIVVEHTPIRELGIGMQILNLLDVSSIVTEVRIEVGLLEEHGIFTTTEQLDTLRLVGEVGAI